ncbi:MAG: phage tail protein, partial [Clostridia bacterium]|nr:phage tail protein [Clostridia bacterium]
MQNTTVLGFLADATSCVVTEERNGVFELTLTYPVTGTLFDKLQIDRFVKAKPNDTADLQLFRIYEVTKPMNGVVTVNAEHVSYALSNFPVEEINITGTATQAINAVLSDVTYDLDYFDKVNPFMVATTDMDAVKTFEFKVGSARAALGGTEGSILDVFGGEYEFDNYTIRLHKHRGRDTGIVIAYGKNMTDIKVTTSLESAYTALYPYAVKDDRLYIANVWEFETEPTLTFIEYDPIMPVQNNAGIADRMLIRDFTNEFVKDETVSNRTLAEKAEKWLQEHDINSPSVNVTVSFVQLWESSEYEELKALESVSLCDWVTVRHKDLGIDMKAQVVKTVYDTIAERYNKIELGSAKANFGDTIRQATDDLTRLVQSVDTTAISSQITREYQAAIQRATKAITGAEWGAVRLTPSICPHEITIANNEDPTRATKVWRWSMGGLGYSPNGYDGPYTTAITAGGEIVADFITAGTLTANIIRAGILTSVNGKSSFNLESGLLKSSNIEVTGGTIKIGGDSYYTYIANGSIAQHMTSGGGLIGG